MLCDIKYCHGNRGMILPYCVYRMEGNFGSGKIWRIHCKKLLAE